MYGVDSWCAKVSLDSMLLISGLAGFNIFSKMQAFGLFRGKMSSRCSFRCPCIDVRTLCVQHLHLLNFSKWSLCTCICWFWCAGTYGARRHSACQTWCLCAKKWGEHCLPSSFVCDVMQRKKWIVICKSSKYWYLGRKHHIHLLVLTLLALGVMKHLPVWNFHGSKVCWRHEQLIVSCFTSLVFSSWHPSFLHVPLLHLLYD